MTGPNAFSAEETLAALRQAMQPEHIGNRFDRGYAWAMDGARTIVGRHRPDASDAKTLAAVTPALRDWLDEGPDYDSHDYNRGCEAGQEAIRLILDGDPDEIISHLEDAARTAIQLLNIAQQRTT
ncbi:hypothetical protein ABR738_00550 [Streptomyces sp. Edi4]|uniref:hypothetical protein n=1 Tax=Streptomyces sp. Edi4 TaxID=3162527 RepID=UPI003306781A